MDIKAERVWLEYQRECIINKLCNKATAAGFKQSLKRLGRIMSDLDKLNKPKK